MRIDALPNGNLYAGSLNIRTGLRGSSFGEALLKNVLDMKSQTHTIEAEAYPRLQFATRYIGEFGFVSTGLIENTAENPKQKQLLHLERPYGIQKIPEFKDASIDDIKSRYISNTYDINDNPIILRFNKNTEMANFLAHAERLFGQGDKALTAYRQDPDDPDYLFAVFERYVDAKKPSADDSRGAEIPDQARAA